MLEYAFITETKELVHVGDVPNGKLCNCVCPECNDALTAKNKGEHVRSHFAHQHKEETRACLMTQLHLVAQQHYLSLKSLALPPVSFDYNGKILNKPETKVSIHHVELEKRIGCKFADVSLYTDVGQVVIEIMVTHKTEEDKVTFYKNKHIASIEYDISDYRNGDIDSALQALENNKVHHEWIYEWCRSELIHAHETKLLKAKLELQRRRLKSAGATIGRLLKERYVVLPSIKYQLSHKAGDKTYTSEVVLFIKKNQEVDSLDIIERTDEYILLKGSLATRHIWVGFLLVDDIPDVISQLDGSIVIRRPATNLKKSATWEWFRHPSNSKKLAMETAKFHEDCEIDYEWSVSTRNAEQAIQETSDKFLNDKDFYFKADYGKWKSWMIQNKLFLSTPEKKNPSIPSVLKYIDSSSLWMFNTWPILIMSSLAEIVDSKPIREPIKYVEVFYELQSKHGIHSAFYYYKKQIHPSKLLPRYRALICKTTIIRNALQSFEEAFVVKVGEREFVRTGSLKETLSAF